MVDIRKSINEIEELNKDDDIFTKTCSEIAKDISAGKIKIHDVVTNLEHLLVNTVPEKRATGTFILSTIITNVPFDFLTNTELQFVSSFYADRLKDHHQVIPAVLQGILAVSRMPNNEGKSIQTLLLSLFDNICCQQQQIADRYKLFEILKEFSINYEKAILGMEQQFILGLISSMDGERDPRCLLFLFTWLPDLLKVLRVEDNLVEELFDVISCYFPVDFRSPPSLTGQKEITRDELAAQLNKCLCAVPSFDQFCVPLILEKLNSALKIAKLDSLNLLAKSCNTFNPSIYDTFSQDIWSSLQKEILNNSDGEVKEACYEAVTAVIGSMSKSDNTEIFTQTCQNMYDTLRGNLRPDVKLFKNSSDLLLAIACGSTKTCRDVIQLVIPIFLNHYNLQSNVNYQHIMFTTLMSYIKTYIDMFEVKDISQVEILAEVAILCMQAIQHEDPSIRIAGYQHIPKIFNIWPKSLREPFYITLKRIIVQQEPANVREEIIKCVDIISDQFSIEVSEQIISKSTSNYENINNLTLYLQTLQILAPKPAFMDIVLEQILSECVNENKIRSHISFSTLKQLLASNKDNTNLYSTLYIKFKIMEKIINSVSLQNNDTELELIVNKAAVCRMIIGKLNCEEQSKIASQYVPLVVNHLGNNSAGKESEHINQIIMLEGLLTMLRSDVNIPDKYGILKILLPYTEKLEQPAYTYVCQIIANVINKSVEDENFTNILSDINLHTDSLFNSLQKSDNSNVLNNSVSLHAWITKALLMKGSSHSNNALNKLILLLDEYEKVGTTFSLIMDDSIPSLGRDAHCQIRLLYRQQFFSYVTQKFNESIKNIKSNYLLAMGAMLSKAPQQIIKVYLQQVLRLMIMCLRDCQQTESLIAVLNTIETLLKENSSQLENHVDNLLECFLHLVSFKSAMSVRMLSLRCLQEVVKNYPVYKLLPHKQKVVFCLSPCLDDKKRLVRQQAVLTRSAWILLDAPI